MFLWKERKVCWMTSVCCMFWSLWRNFCSDVTFTRLLVNTTQTLTCHRNVKHFSYNPLKEIKQTQMCLRTVLDIQYCTGLECTDIKQGKAVFAFVKITWVRWGAPVISSVWRSWWRCLRCCIISVGRDLSPTRNYWSFRIKWAHGWAPTWTTTTEWDSFLSESDFHLSEIKPSVIYN